MLTDISLPYLTMGAFFGLTAGISPGPLLALVITETLKHGRREGIKVAIAPLITDLPIILIIYLVFSRVSQSEIILAVISVMGGIYFAWLGYETLKNKGFNIDLPNRKPDSLKKGITANILNPNPYIFWLTAGIPNAFRAYEKSHLTVVLYFLLFYLMLIGSKTVVALVAEKSGTFLKQTAYRIIMVVLGTALLGFSLYFFVEGLRIMICR